MRAHLSHATIFQGRFSAMRLLLLQRTRAQRVRNVSEVRGANRPLFLERWGSEGLGAVDRRHACREGCGYEHGDTDGPGKGHTK